MILDDQPTSLEDVGLAEELKGKPGSDPEEERLAHSVMENDEQVVRDGNLLAESVDYALGSFTPDLMFEQLTKQYRNAQRLYGPTIIRELTGYDSSYIERNLKISEFKEQLKERISEGIDRLKKQGLLNDDGELTDHGITLASLVLYTEELDHLKAHGIGKREKKERSPYGDRGEKEPFKRHSYRDLDIKGSIRKAIRRGHANVEKTDFVATTREQHGKVSIVYALDASGSMRGTKLKMSKKAGIALAFRAIEDGNDAGLLTFTSKINESVPPTKDFGLLLRTLTTIRAGEETDLANAVEHAMTLFPKHQTTKHLLVLTDALPTKGDNPGKATLDAVAQARDAGVTISIVGIDLEEEGEKLAKRMTELGNGRLYRVKNLDELDLVVLEEYDAITQR